MANIINCKCFLALLIFINLMPSRTCSTKGEMFTVLEFKWMLAGQINERVCHFLGTLTSKTTKFLNLVKQKKKKEWKFTIHVSLFLVLEHFCSLNLFA